MQEQLPTTCKDAGGRAMQEQLPRNLKAPAFPSPFKIPRFTRHGNLRITLGFYRAWR